MKANKISLKAFLEKLPKAELHSHIDGGLRDSTICDLAKKFGIDAPSYDPIELASKLYRPKYESLGDFLSIFGINYSIMRTPEAVERISYEFASDYIHDGVYLLEGRLAPHLLINESMKTTLEVLVAVNEGLKKAAMEHNMKPEVQSHEVPEFRYGIICSMMRNCMKGVSTYYNRMYEKYGSGDVSKNSVEVRAGLRLVEECVQARDEYKLPIVAIDLAGDEKGYPPEPFSEVFELARKNMFRITVHAGEAAGARSIHGAVSVLAAERIGHGFNLFAKPEGCKNPNFNDELIEYIIAKHITIEVCITSNVKILKEISKNSEHPVKKMLEKGIKVSLCCDDKQLLKSEVSDELFIAIKDLKLTMKEIRKIILTGFEKSFSLGSSVEKAKYLRSIREYYDKIEKSYEIMDT